MVLPPSPTNTRLHLRHALEIAHTADFVVTDCAVQKLQAETERQGRGEAHLFSRGAEEVVFTTSRLLYIMAFVRSNESADRFIASAGFPEVQFLLNLLPSSLLRIHGSIIKWSYWVGITQVVPVKRSPAINPFAQTQSRID